MDSHITSRARIRSSRRVIIRTLQAQNVPCVKKPYAARGPLGREGRGGCPPGFGYQIGEAAIGALLLFGYLRCACASVIAPLSWLHLRCMRWVLVRS